MVSGEFQNSVAKVAFLLINYLFNNLIAAERPKGASSNIIRI